MPNLRSILVIAIPVAITTFLFISADSGSDLWTAAWVGFSICMAIVAWFAWTSVKETSLLEMALPISITLLLFLSSIGAGLVNQLRNEQTRLEMITSTALVDESILTGVVRMALLELYDAHLTSGGRVGFDELMRSGVGTIDSTNIKQFGVIQLTESSADRVVFTAQTRRSIQFTGTVTSEGVRYERQN